MDQQSLSRRQFRHRRCPVAATVRRVRSLSPSVTPISARLVDLVRHFLESDPGAGREYRLRRQRLQPHRYGHARRQPGRHLHHHVNVENGQVCRQRNLRSDRARPLVAYYRLEGDGSTAAARAITARVNGGATFVAGKSRHRRHSLQWDQRLCADSGLYP